MKNIKYELIGIDLAEDVDITFYTGNYYKNGVIIDYRKGENNGKESDISKIDQSG